MKRKKIVMLGSTSQGGITSVVDVYRAAGLFARFPIVYLTTHRDGGRLSKLRALAHALATFVWLALSGQIALVHIHVASRASFWRKSLFFWPAWVFRVPVIMHLHGAEFAIFYEQECGWLRKALVRAVFDRAARVVVLSAAWNRWMRSVTRNPRVETIFNPVLVPVENAWNKRTPGQVLFLGRLGARKGSFDLVGAFSKLVPDRPEASLLMGGDGELAQTMRCADELGVGSHVELLGWVGAEQRANLLASSWLYALPSYNEGLPMSVLEAMAAGVPVLSTPVGGIPEVVTDGVEGFLVPPGDVQALAERMARLLSDAALARAMGVAARRKIETTFSSAAVLPQVERMYEALGIARI